MMIRPQEEDENIDVVKNQQEDEAAENPKKNSKPPSNRVIPLVLCVLLAAAVFIFYRISMRTANQTVQTLKEENEALRKKFSAVMITDQLVQEETEALKREISDQTYVKCGAAWELHGGKCYYFNTYKLSWQDSRQSCREFGGDLVKIDSREEQVFLIKILSDKMISAEDMFWIGLTDLEKEEHFLWVDGSPLNKSFWGYNQPDDLSGHSLSENADCVRMGNKEHLDLNCWFDRSCDDPHKSVCEKSAETYSCVCV